MTSAPLRRTVLKAAAPALTVSALAACGPSTDGGNGTDGTAGTGGTDPSDAGGDGSSDGGTSTDPTTPPPDPAEQIVADLTTREAAAQLVLVGIQAGSEPDPELIEETKVGGFFLLGHWTSADAVRSVVEQVTGHAADEDAGLVPLVCVDQEGGQIRMLRGDAATRTDSAADLGAQGEDAVAEAYGTIGEDLSSLDIRVAFAPVADVVDPDLGEANAPVGALGRGFGTDPEEVGACVSAAVGALHDQGVAATLKHFPGLGRVRENTDFSSEDITDETTTADDPFLDSFRAGIDAGAELVMLSSAVYPRIDEDNPAMFSRAVVTDLLRGDLGFAGLVITDDIGAAAAVQDIPVADRATRLLEAGGDMVITADPTLAGDLVDAIEEWAEEDQENEDQVRESAARVVRLRLADPADEVEADS
jgi:beta-N-acetylhexosaminidase